MSDQSRHDADPDVRSDPQVGSHGLDPHASNGDAVDLGADDLLFAHLDAPEGSVDGYRADGYRDREHTAAAEPVAQARADAFDPDGDGPAGPEPERKGSFFRELPMLLVIAFLLAFLLRTFVVQVFFIPSGSMEPTLQIDDRMVVEKITYLFREPQRGEVVVFEGESNAAVDIDANIIERAVRGFGQFVGVVPASARDFVKRVIGLPGDEILIEEGRVYVNGTPLDEPYARLDQSDFGPVVVPDDSLFFLGDNRANSSDSRRGLGFVPLDAVVGRSLAIMWPFDHAGGLTGVEYPAVPDPGDRSGSEEAGDGEATGDGEAVAGGPLVELGPGAFGGVPLGAIWDLEAPA